MTRPLPDTDHVTVERSYIQAIRNQARTYRIRLQAALTQLAEAGLEYQEPTIRPPTDGGQR
jgi:hypothetical protein